MKKKMILVSSLHFTERMGSKMHRITFGIIALCSGMLLAADVECTWTAEKPVSLGDGAVKFAYDDGGSVAGIEVSPLDGGAVSLSGDAMPLAADVRIEFKSPGRLVINNSLTGEGCVAVTNSASDRRLEYDGARLGTADWTLMFSNALLADYVPLKSIRGSGNGEYDAGVYYPYNVKRFEKDGFSQMSVTLVQAKAGFVESKIVLMRLRQNGANIEGILDRACYHSTRHIHGEDIERLIARNEVSPDPNFTTNSLVHTPQSDGGYGVNNFFMERTDSAEVEFRGAVASTISIKPSCGACVKMLPSAVDGALTNRVDGSGLFTVAAPEQGAEQPDVDSYDGFIASSAVTVSKNRMLTTLTNVFADISGSYVSGNYFPALFCQVRGNNLCITGEVQVATDNYTWRFVVLELKQSSFNVVAKALSAGYVKIEAKDGGVTGYIGGGYSVLDSRFDGYRTYVTPATGSTSHPVGACHFRFAYSEAASSLVEVGASFANEMEPENGLGQNMSADAVFRIAGNSDSRVSVRIPNNSSAAAFPAKGIVEVAEGGELLMEYAAISGNSSLIRVLSGGRLRIRRASALDQAQHVHLLGGELIMRDDSSFANSDSWCSLERVTLRDGAVVKGMPFQMGYVDGSASWRVSGDSPSSCEASALLKGGTGTSIKKMEFNVLDVTDDGEIDFHYHGDINAHTETAKGALLRKTGGGTLAHYGSFGNLTPSSQPVSIEAGEWLMHGSASPSQPYSMNGGNLSAAAGTVNSAGSLAVVGSGVLSVGTGGKLSIADSSSVAWADGVRVTVVGDLASGAIRFGESPSALTSAQLAKMRYDGRRVYLDNAGYLRDAGVFGTVISIR